MSDLHIAVIPISFVHEVNELAFYRIICLLFFPHVSILRKKFFSLTILLQFSRQTCTMFISSISEILLELFSYYINIYLAILVIEFNEITGFSIFDYVLLRFGCTAIYNSVFFSSNLLLFTIYLLRRSGTVSVGLLCCKNYWLPFPDGKIEYLPTQFQQRRGCFIFCYFVFLSYSFSVNNLIFLTEYYWWESKAFDWRLANLCSK